MHKFRSKFEARIWENLGKKGQKEVDYEPDEPVVKYNVPHRYIPDYVIKRNGICVEAKGYFPPRDRGKMRRVKRDNPDLDIRFLFMKAGTKIGKSKGSKTYGEWANYHGFPWAEGDTIPEEWINE